MSVGHGLKMRGCLTLNPFTWIVSGFNVGHFGGAVGCLLVSFVEEAETFLKDGELIIADV